MEEFRLKQMDEEKSIRPYKNGRPNGHWIVYDRKGKFWYECYFINGVEYGYELWANTEVFYHAI